IARLLWVDGPVRVFSLAIGLTTSEYARGHLFTGFPWNLFGQAVGFTDLTAQAAAVAGVYGLTAIGLVVFAAPAVLADDETSGPRWARGAVLAAAAIAVLADLGYGAARLSSAPAVPADGGGGRPRVRIVQPAVDQARKWDPESRLATLEGLVSLSERR